MGIKEQLQELEDKISKGLEKAYEKMIKFKEQKETPIVISKDGKILKVYPKDLKKEE
ncbi:hypothetical protein [Changchengzhania lutea]|uniref:hypothetical protein n=1 Tax=Changchengzhania lutea TaxID=2049305 RepID=UPI00163DDD9B|nr:hypothetical protein [Changchengzhania lutea]